MLPRENALGPLRAEKLLADEKLEHVPGEDLGQPRVVDAGDETKAPFPIRPALGHQEMEVGVEVDPVAEGLQDGDDAKRERAAGDGLEIPLQGPNSFYFSVLLSFSTSTISVLTHQLSPFRSLKNKYLPSDVIRAMAALS